MRAPLLAAAMLLLAALAAPPALAQDEDASTGSGASGDCVAEVTLAGRDDLRWYLGEGSEPNPRVMRLCAHADVLFTIVAEGDIPHNFRVEAPGAPPATDVVSGGERTTYAWTTPAEGVYAYICLIHGRQMSGTVAVGEDVPPPMPPERVAPTPYPAPPHPSPSHHGPPLAGMLFALIPLLGPIFGFGALVAAYAGAWF